MYEIDLYVADGRFICVHVHVSLRWYSLICLKCSGLNWIFILYIVKACTLTASPSQTKRVPGVVHLVLSPSLWCHGLTVAKAGWSDCTWATRPFFLAFGTHLMLGYQWWILAQTIPESKQCQIGLFWGWSPRNIHCPKTLSGLWAATCSSQKTLAQHRHSQVPFSRLCRWRNCYRSDISAHEVISVYNYKSRNRCWLQCLLSQTHVQSHFQPEVFGSKPN